MEGRTDGHGNHPKPFLILKKMPAILHAHVYGIKLVRTTSSSRSYYHCLSLTISTKSLLSVLNIHTLTNHANSSILEDERVPECDILVW
jgi:hypothetical protein